MSISPEHANKKQCTTAVDQETRDKQPKYLNVPDSVFKHMLSLSLEDNESIIHMLNDTTKLQMIRQHARLINDSFFLKLKQQYWNHYYTLIIIEQVDLPVLPKRVARENYIRQCDFKPRAKVEYILKNLQEQLISKQQDLLRFEQVMMKEFSPHHQLSSNVTAFVRRGQRHLHLAYEYRMKLLEWNIRDYRLVEPFYALKPTTDQVRTKNRQQNGEFQLSL